MAQIEFEAAKYHGKWAVFGFDVKQGDKTAIDLSYDEMLGLISALTMPEQRPCLHWMKTEKQRESFERYLEEKKKLRDELLLIEYHKRSEAETCKAYKNIIHNALKRQRVELNEKVWIKTQIRGYEFTACNVVDFTDNYFIRIEIYNDDGGIHCNADLLNSAQLKELASAVIKSLKP